MDISKQVFITKKKGFLVSTVKFSPEFYNGVFETMVFRDSEEHIDNSGVDCERTKNHDDARTAHQRMVEKYCNS